MSTTNYVIIDVREPDEYSEGHIDGAINIPPDQLLSGAPQLSSIPKDTPLLLYCKSGARSNTASHILQAQGFNNITNGINKERVEAQYYPR